MSPSHRLDPVAVTELTTGRTVPGHTHAERRTAARAMRDAGMLRDDIADRLHVTIRTVDRLLLERPAPMPKANPHRQHGAQPTYDTDPWETRARCIDADPETFHPTRPCGSSAYLRQVYREQVAQAKAYCAECPVLDKCLARAFELDATGVWGGTTDDERARMRRRKRPAA